MKDKFKKNRHSIDNDLYQIREQRNRNDNKRDRTLTRQLLKQEFKYGNS